MDESRLGGRRAERTVAGCLVAGIVGALAAATVYWFGGQPQLEGLFLAVTFGGLGTGLVVSAHRLLPDDDVTESWPYATGPAGAQDDEHALTEFHDDLDRDQGARAPDHAASSAARQHRCDRCDGGLPDPVVGPEAGPFPAGRAVAARRPRRRQRRPGGAGRRRPRRWARHGLSRGAPRCRRCRGRAGSGPTDSPRSTGTEPPVDGIYVYSKICTHAGCAVGLYVDERRTR